MGTASATMMSISTMFSSSVIGQPLADLGEHGLAVGQEGAAEVEPRDAA